MLMSFVQFVASICSWFIYLDMWLYLCLSSWIEAITIGAIFCNWACDDMSISQVTSVYSNKEHRGYAWKNNMDAGVCRMFTYITYIWKGVLPSMSCPSKACDLAMGTHSSSSQLTEKCIWGVVCCVIFMATNDATERVVYISDTGQCCTSDQTRLNCCIHSSLLHCVVI